VHHLLLAKQAVGAERRHHGGRVGNPCVPDLLEGVGGRAAKAAVSAEVGAHRAGLVPVRAQNVAAQAAALAPVVGEQFSEHRIAAHGRRGRVLRWPRLSGLVVRGRGKLLGLLGDHAVPAVTSAMTAVTPAMGAASLVTDHTGCILPRVLI